MEKKLELPVYLFHQGTAERAYDFLGAHPEERNGKSGFLFRVYAPRAKSVSLTGDFNAWNQTSHPLCPTDGGIWEVFVSGLGEFESYKYVIEGRDGKTRMKADPYGFHMETRPATASKTCDLRGYQWKDQGYRQKQTGQGPYDRPMNIYEVHAGSWRRYADGNSFSYGKLAEELVPYVKEMGYTHVELMPLAEYPFDGSWGYQIIGYYAPTSRYGTPKDLMALVDTFHQAGIGVILDWVPGHFPKDEAGLFQFDGGPCYEYEEGWKAEHRQWGTMVFDWGKPQVRSFLISNAMYWMEQYHMDGLRVDAVASMLYLDYNRKDGEWKPNRQGGKENLEAVSFLQQLNRAVFSRFPHALMIAEESTAWPMITMPVDVGGLGFNFKWNMGWMNDTLDYMKTDPLFRGGNHRKMTFPLTYAFSENYILPLSHDEVVHMKGSLSNKMPGGSTEEKLAHLRAYLAYMFAHPGKKLLFMGGEFAQFEEWHFEGQLDWGCLEQEAHNKFGAFVRELNHFYMDSPMLWENDQNWEGFRWIDPDDADRNILSFRRIGIDGKELLVFCNFAPVAQPCYPAEFPSEGIYDVVFRSDEERYGGAGIPIKSVNAKPVVAGGASFPAKLSLPPLSVIFLRRR